LAKVLLHIGEICHRAQPVRIGGEAVYARRQRGFQLLKRVKMTIGGFIFSQILPQMLGGIEVMTPRKLEQ
jgi:hypothetical protein